MDLSNVKPYDDDFTITDSSDEGDYFPKRGRSPPAPLRYEIKDPPSDDNLFTLAPADSQNQSDEPPSNVFDTRGEEQTAKERSTAEAPRLKEIPLHAKWDEHHEKAAKYMQAARKRGGAEDDFINSSLGKAETFDPTSASNEVRYASPPAQYSDDEAPSASLTQDATSTTGPSQPLMSVPRRSRTRPAPRQGRWRYLENRIEIEYEAEDEELDLPSGG
jgi:hypothetical protein